eukprot:100813-Chlamydomonas_euryale.AAC.6
MLPAFPRTSSVVDIAQRQPKGVTAQQGRAHGAPGLRGPGLTDIGTGAIYDPVKARRCGGVAEAPSTLSSQQLHGQTPVPLFWSRQC